MDLPPPSWYAVLLRPRDPEVAGRQLTDAEVELLGRQFAFVGSLHSKGAVALSGRSLDPADPFGIVVLRAADSEEAESEARQMPGVAGGFFTHEVHPFELMLLGAPDPASTYAYLLRPSRADILETGPTEEEKRLQAEHWDYTTTLHADGRLRFAGRTLTAADPVAVLVVAADDDEAARRIVAEEPGVRGGLFTLVSLRRFDVALLGEPGMVASPT